ncbi:hypothetical protein N431DRAFT_478101 [Stipitochalara longipes BDJ]|nr:hypothetical protein N431DRAFT_478101 [Stipitochalara longipes BDJ]
MSASESTQTAQSIHQPPPISSPAWIRIPATDVPRAQKFYEEVFDWKFHDHSSAGYSVDKLAVFTIPGAPTLMGGIGKVEVEEGASPRKKGDGAILLYMRVQSVEETLAKAENAGGEVSKEKWTEGDHTQLGEFRDTEGNLVGVLKWVM